MLWHMGKILYLWVKGSVELGILVLRNYIQEGEANNTV